MNIQQPTSNVEVELHIQWAFTPFYRNWPWFWPKPDNKVGRILHFVVKLCWWCKPISWWVIEKSPGRCWSDGHYMTANDAAMELAKRSVERVAQLIRTSQIENLVANKSTDHVDKTTTIY